MFNVISYCVVVSLLFVHQAALQVGGHGERLHQCREVVLTTFKTVPVQVSTHSTTTSLPVTAVINCIIVTYRLYSNIIKVLKCVDKIKYHNIFDQIQTI